MRRVLVLAGLVALAAGTVPPAFASPDFTPTTRFSLSTRTASANPEVTVKVAQDEGEESIDKLMFVIPAGFKLPGDAAISDGEQLGEGQIQVAAAPLCNAASQQTFDMSINERDRTEEETQQGIKAVWVVDLQFIEVDLLIRGSARDGWRITGDVPNSDATCPPFGLSAVVNETSADSGVKIWRNPRKPGHYTLKAIWTSTEDTKHTIKQKVKITE